MSKKKKKKNRWSICIKVITYGLPFEHKQSIFVHPPRESISVTPSLIVIIQSLIEKRKSKDVWYD